MFQSPYKIKDWVEQDHIQNPPNSKSNFQTTNSSTYKVHSVSPPKRRFESPPKPTPFFASTTYRNLFSDYPKPIVDYYKEPQYPVYSLPFQGQKKENLDLSNSNYKRQERGKVM